MADGSEVKDGSQELKQRVVQGSTSLLPRAELIAQVHVESRFIARSAPQSPGSQFFVYHPGTLTLSASGRDETMLGRQGRIEPMIGKDFLAGRRENEHHEFGGFVFVAHLENGQPVVSRDGKRRRQWHDGHAR